MADKPAATPEDLKYARKFLGEAFKTCQENGLNKKQVLKPYKTRRSKIV